MNMEHTTQQEWQKVSTEKLTESFCWRFVIQWKADRIILKFAFPSFCVSALRRKKNSYVSAVPAGWNFFSAHPGAWEIHYSIFSFHTQIPLLFSALFTLTPAWLNSEVEISGKRNTQSPSISFWQHRIIGKTFFLCLWYDQINVSNTTMEWFPSAWDIFWDIQGGGLWKKLGFEKTPSRIKQSTP